MVRITMDKTIMKKFGLQWSHVFSDMVSGSLSLSAATCSSLQWSHVFSDMVRTLALDRAAILCHKLQWSHVFSDMVSARNVKAVMALLDASMEPCLFRHGKRHQDR